MCNIAYVKTTKNSNFFIEKQQQFIKKLHIFAKKKKATYLI